MWSKPPNTKPLASCEASTVVCAHRGRCVSPASRRYKECTGKSVENLEREKASKAALQNQNKAQVEFNCELQEELAQLRAQLAVSQTGAQRQAGKAADIEAQRAQLEAALQSAEQRLRDGELVRRKLHNTILVRPALPAPTMHQASPWGGTRSAADPGAAGTEGQHPGLLPGPAPDPGQPHDRDRGRQAPDPVPDLWCAPADLQAIFCPCQPSAVMCFRAPRLRSD